MTITDAQVRLAKIDQAVHQRDHEAAHIEEDELHRATLRAVAEGAPEPWRGLAATALLSVNLSFKRWRA